MEFFENETPKHKKKRDQKSKSSHRSDHKHDYERVIIKGTFYSYVWMDRCKVCGRTKSVNYSLSKEGLRKPFTGSIPRSGDEYTVEEIMEKFPGVRIFTYRRDEKGVPCFGDDGLIEITSNREGDA